MKDMGLDTVELVIAVEEHFAIEIPDRVAETLVTVGLLHRFVTSELERVGHPRASEDTFEELRKLICHQLGVKPEQVVAEARFVEDLRID